MHTPLPRHLMVEAQIRTNKVIDPRLLDILRALPREQFVPEDKQALAYADTAVEMSSGRYLLSPMLLARLLESAALSEGMKVLHIGTLLGYTPIVCGLLGARVTSVESLPHWAAGAQKLVKTHAPSADITLVQGTLNAGAPQHGDYDVVLIDAGVEVVPPAIVRQLAPNGRIFAVEHIREGFGRATEWRKQGEALVSVTLFDAAAALLPGFSKPALFSL